MRPGRWWRPRRAALPAGRAAAVTAGGRAVRVDVGVLHHRLERAHGHRGAPALDGHVAGAHRLGRRRRSSCCSSPCCRACGSADARPCSRPRCRPELPLAVTIRESARFVTLYVAITAIGIIALATLGWTGVDPRMDPVQSGGQRAGHRRDRGLLHGGPLDRAVRARHAVGVRRLHGRRGHELRPHVRGRGRPAPKCLRPRRGVPRLPSCCWRCRRWWSPSAWRHRRRPRRRGGCALPSSTRCR